MRIRLVVSAILVGGALLSGCISHTVHLLPEQVLLQADTIAKSALLEKLRTDSRAIQTLVVSKSTLKASRMLSNETIKNYHDVSGRIVVDRPGRIRLEIEKLTTLAQMVSDEKQYRVYVPIEGKFGVGDVAAPVRGAEFPYNLRPNHILDALFVDGEQFIGKPGIDTYLIVVTDSQPDGVHSYSVVFFGKAGSQVPLEELWFDRTIGIDQVVRKKSYLPDGEIEADIRYSNYEKVGNVSFPMKIVIKRPVENYALEMNIEKVELNKAVDPAYFKLDRPNGVDDVDLNTGKDLKPK
jgi:hypothetical protein